MAQNWRPRSAVAIEDEGDSNSPSPWKPRSAIAIDDPEDQRKKQLETLKAANKKPLSEPATYKGGFMKGLSESYNQPAEKTALNPRGDSISSVASRTIPGYDKWLDEPLARERKDIPGDYMGGFTKSIWNDTIRPLTSPANLAMELATGGALRGKSKLLAPPGKRLLGAAPERKLLTANAGPSSGTRFLGGEAGMTEVGRTYPLDLGPVGQPHISGQMDSSGYRMGGGGQGTVLPRELEGMTDLSAETAARIGNKVGRPQNYMEGEVMSGPPSPPPATPPPFDPSSLGFSKASSPEVIARTEMAPYGNGGIMPEGIIPTERRIANQTLPEGQLDRRTANKIQEPVTAASRGMSDRRLDEFAEKFGGQQGVSEPSYKPKSAIPVEGVPDSSIAPRESMPTSTSKIDSVERIRETPTAKFLGYQPDGMGGQIELFNIEGGTSHGSSVGIDKLKELGITVPTDRTPMRKPGQDRGFYQQGKGQEPEITSPDRGKNRGDFGEPSPRPSTLEPRIATRISELSDKLRREGKTILSSDKTGVRWQAASGQKGFSEIKWAHQPKDVPISPKSEKLLDSFGVKGADIEPMSGPPQVGGKYAPEVSQRNVVETKPVIEPFSHQGEAIPRSASELQSKLTSARESIYHARAAVAANKTPETLAALEAAEKNAKTLGTRLTAARIREGVNKPRPGLHERLKGEEGAIGDLKRDVIQQSDKRIKELEDRSAYFRSELDRIKNSTLTGAAEKVDGILDKLKANNKALVEAKKQNSSMLGRLKSETGAIGDLKNDPLNPANTTKIKKGADFKSDGNYDVEFSNGRKTRIFYDKASQTWYEDKPTTKQHTSHYSDHWGFTKEELVNKLKKFYSDETGAIGDLKNDPKRLESFSLPEEPSFARTKGGVKIGADVASLGKILGSSLYKGDIVTISTKELLQNSLDAIKKLGASGRIDIELNKVDHFVQVADNGPGLSKRELETVFTDLGASGKRDDVTAIGGFGLAKAAPLLGGKSVKVTSVVKEHGKYYKHEFSGTPDELLRGVDIRTTIVDPSTPTGVTVRTYVPEDSIYYSANDLIESISKNSIGRKGTINYQTKNYADEDFNELPKSHPGIDIKDANVTNLSNEASDVEIIIPKGASYAPRSGIRYKILNNGMYQGYDRYGYQEIPGIPDNVIVNIKSKVPEGHTDYPFTTNREELRGSTKKQIEEYLEKTIVKPSVGKRMDELNKVYTSMPEVDIPTATGKMKFHVYDTGSRYTADELASMIKDPHMKNLATDISDILHDALAIQGESAWTERLEKIGFIFDEKLHGIHIPSPATGKSAILINPFSLMKNKTPDGASAGFLHTILHEIGHIHGGGHDEGFTMRLGSIYERFGASAAVEAQARFLQSISHPSKPGEYSDKIQELLSGYSKSRGREATQIDLLSGTGIGSKTGQKGQKGIFSSNRPNGSGTIGKMKDFGRQELQKMKDFPSEVHKSIKEERYLSTIGNTSRAIMASGPGDLSAVLRQGITMGHKKSFRQNLVPMVKQYLSPKYAAERARRITSHPKYEQLKKMGVEFTGLDGAPREERFLNTLAEKIPLAGHLTKASNRAYAGFLNDLRLDTSLELLTDLKKLGRDGDRFATAFTKKGKMIEKPTKLQKDVANFVNIFTGRGPLGALEPAARVLNATIFSPHLMSSRLHMLNPKYYWKADPFARKEALKSMAILAGVVGTTSGLAYLVGADISLDPQSSDFLKAKFGNSRVDFGGGLQQYIVAASRLGPEILQNLTGLGPGGKTTSTGTGKTSNIGEGYRGVSGKDILYQFIENKEAPLFSFATAILKGTDFKGDPINVPKEVADRFTYLIVQDLRDMLTHNRTKTGAALMLPAMFGAPVQTYPRTSTMKLPKPTLGKLELGQ